MIGACDAGRAAPPVSVRAGTDQREDPLRISAQDVTPGFFETMGIPLVTGREFDGREAVTSPSVVVLNESAARVLFGAPSTALGRQIRIGTETPREVVGVVRSTRSAFYNTLEWQTNPVIFLPAPQAFNAIRDPTVRSLGMHLYVRASRTLSMPEVKRTVASLNAGVVVSGVRSASDAVADATRQPALQMVLLGWFSSMSLLLAAIGVYGLVSQGIVQRRREIGIRVALGAEPRDVFHTIIRPVLATGILGSLCGCLAAVALGNALKVLLYGVPATDVLSYLVAVTALLTVAIVAAMVPALRAARIDPVEMLRAE